MKRKGLERGWRANEAGRSRKAVWSKSRGRKEASHVCHHENLEQDGGEVPVSQCISGAHLPGAQRTQNILAADRWKGSSEAI